MFFVIRAVLFFMFPLVYEVFLGFGQWPVVASRIVSFGWFMLFCGPITSPYVSPLLPAFFFGLGPSVFGQAGVYLHP